MYELKSGDVVKREEECEVISCDLKVFNSDQSDEYHFTLAPVKAYLLHEIHRQTTLPRRADDCQDPFNSFIETLERRFLLLSLLGTCAT